MIHPPGTQAEMEFPLRRGSVVLEREGVRHPRSVTLGGRVFTRYADITHLQLGGRTLRLATRRGVFWLPRRAFLDASAPEHLVRALLERIFHSPDGAAQLSRMAEIEELARTSGAPRACSAVAGLCIAVAGAGMLKGPLLHVAGMFSATLVQHGELWRLVTANLLHAPFPLHLLFNVLGLLGLGLLVERPLGSVRTAFVLGLSGLGAMLVSLAVGYENLVGASGMVAGLAGAALWLELRLPERLPAFWRIPRRTFITLLILDACLPLVLPPIAGMAHAGGFLGGALATALSATPRLRRDPPGLPLLAANALLAAIVSASLVAAAPLALGRPGAWSAHATRLLRIPEVHPVVLNDAAWLLATEVPASRADLEKALRLAERAVEATHGADPNVLDTLAEVLFRTGRVDAALVTIDRAIALAPGEPYFREQRRRFLGERPADEMPPPPRLPLEPPPAPLPAPEEPGVRA